MSDGGHVTRNTGSNYRAMPFARDDVVVLAESVAGETLTITGIVRQADGDWYELRLRDGRTAYLKSNLSEVVAPPESRGPLAVDPDLLPPGPRSPADTVQEVCADQLSGPECGEREDEVIVEDSSIRN